MQEPPVQPFDDPALKVALRRSLGRESAPADLRQRIRGLAKQDGASGGVKAKDKTLPLRRSPLYKFAVAEVLILGFGGLGYQIWQMNQKPSYDVATVISDDLYKAMKTTHMARVGGQAGPDAGNNLGAAAGVGGQVKRPVFAGGLAEDGWAV